MQHAYQLAWALHEAGHLLAFWSGVPLADASRPGQGWGRLSPNLLRTPVPASRRRHFVAFPVLRRLLTGVSQPTFAESLNHRLDHAFDRWVARRAAKLRPDMVVCYENSALHTFRAAKKEGAVCVLDAASIHYRAGGRFLASIGQRNPPWVDSQKQQEIELADAILTCSSFAAETYAAEGVPRVKLNPCVLGTELVETRRRPKSASKTFRFVFVGSLSLLKGIDLLLDIFEGFHRDGVPATLTLIGGVVDRDLAARWRSIPAIMHRPYVRKPALFEAIAEHDCLVLPSRLDSFGMVVPEAMSVGVPVIVSDRVGAKCIIERHPHAGWVVPLEIGAMRAQMLRAIEDRACLGMASRAAATAALDYSWAAYRRRLVPLLQDIHKLHPA
jgi:glycosyltransferase involved in cell wall biosynthesis